MTPNLHEILSRGIQEHQAGRLDEARRCYESVLQGNPNDPDALHLMGVLLQQAGEPTRALEMLARAVNLSPGTVEFINDLGLALQQQGRSGEAIECYRRSLALRPNEVDTLLKLAEALDAAGHHAQAKEVLDHVLSLSPESAAALGRLGAIHLRERRLPDAISVLSKCLELNPDDAMARENLGIALLFEKRSAASVPHLQRVIESGKAIPSTYHHLGMALLAAGEPDEALVDARNAVDSNPRDVAAWELLGQCFRSLKRNGEAMDAFARALEINPDDPALHYSMANVLISEHQPDEAIEHSRQAIARAPEFALAHLTLAGALMDQGLQDQSIETYRHAVSLDAELAAVETNYLLALHFSPNWSAEQIREETSRWTQRYAAPLYPHDRAFDNDRSLDPRRPLRVGFISGDFRMHPIGRFLAHLFERFDPQQAQIICFSDVVSGDALTERFRRAAHQWNSTFGMNDQELADKIRAEKIDILVDLSLFAFQRRLLVFARKPAPIQLTYLAYPGTSGLATIDYRISDPFIDPPGTENFYSEKTLHVPSYFCYEAPTDAPDVSPLPAAHSGLVTFGCFNKFAKVTEPMLRNWLEILAQTPESRLLLNCDSNQRFSQIRDEFASRVNPARLEQIRTVPAADYFKLYHRIDIALDPHPFAGGTTTCDSLYMGVPVVTLAGRNGVSRSGVSILSQAALSELIAPSPQEYIEIAKTLASDVGRLTALRSTLRERMRNSPLMDANACASALQQTFRAIWKNWCRLHF